ncbi:class I SAM-dependent methyltransferase [Staphylococcus sp. 11261D007BR]
MIVERILPFAKSLVKSHIASDSIVIDATCGNGHDTLYLAQNVPNGYVYACDIQEEAIQQTAQRINQYDNVKLIKSSHDLITNYLAEEHQQRIDVAMFNLGYLPKGDKTIVTHPETTIRAIETIFQHLSTEGLIVLAIYPGHPEGYRESEVVLEYLQHFDQNKAHILKYEFINQRNHPPYIIGIEKR